MIGPAGCFQSPSAQKSARKYLVDDHLASGLKLSPAQHHAVMGIRHAGTVQRRQLSGVEKRTYNSLEKKGLVLLVFQPYGRSFYELRESHE